MCRTRWCSIEWAIWSYSPALKAIECSSEIWVAETSPWLHQGQWDDNELDTMCMEFFGCSSENVAKYVSQLYINCITWYHNGINIIWSYCDQNLTYHNISTSYPIHIHIISTHVSLFRYCWILCMHCFLLFSQCFGTCNHHVNIMILSRNIMIYHDKIMIYHDIIISPSWYHIDTILNPYWYHHVTICTFYVHHNDTICIYYVYNLIFICTSNFIHAIGLQ